MTTFSIYFEYIIWLIVLLFGLDFIFSGYLVFMSDTKYLKKPKLFGLLAIAACQNLFERSKSKNKYMEIKYSYKYMRVYTIISGILLIMISINEFFEIWKLR